MFGYEVEITINAPAERIYRVVTDARKWSLWTSMRDTKVLSGAGFNQVGSRIESVMSDGPGKPKLVFEVTAAEANKRVAFKTVSKSPIEWDGDTRLEPQGSSGTRVVSKSEIRSRGWLNVLEFFMRGEIKKGEQKSLEALKQLLESSQT
jgi:uncharacterized protein YndB with AHSA1/START domain